MKRKSKAQLNKGVLSDKDLIDTVKKKAGVNDARVISPGDVETAEWVWLKCRFGCDGYGQTLVCPPYSPTPQQMREVLDSYKRAILIHFAPKTKIKTTVVALEREFFLRGAWKVFGIGAGACSFCEECNLEKKQCRNPEHARPAMEACGIDVFSTVKKSWFSYRGRPNKKPIPELLRLDTC